MTTTENGDLFPALLMVHDIMLCDVLIILTDKDDNLFPCVMESYVAQMNAVKFTAAK